MTEPINYHKHKGDWIGFMLIHSVMNPEDKAANVTVDPSHVQAQLFMNGVEFNMIPAIQKMAKRFDTLVEERAQEIVQEQLMKYPFKDLDEVRDLTDRLKHILKDNIDQHSPWNK